MIFFAILFSPLFILNFVQKLRKVKKINELLQLEKSNTTVSRFDYKNIAA